MKTLLLFGFSLFGQIIFSQPPGIEWQKCLGGSSSDAAASIQQTTDGGYIVAGSTISNNGDVSGNHGGLDAWVIKLNSSGGIIWQKCFGGTAHEWSSSIRQTTDGGYILAGVTFSNDGDVSGWHEGYNQSGDETMDAWVVKMTSGGIIQWQKCLGGTGDDWAKSIQQTSDGGYIVGADTDSNNGDVSGFHGGRDFWVVKLNSTGGIVWQKCLGGSLWEQSQSIKQTTDGGYIITGDTESNDGDVNGWHVGYDQFGGTLDDFWVVRLNSTGGIVWQKCLGGSKGESATSIQQTADGGYIVAGDTESNDGDVSGNHGGFDDWIIKLNSAGGIEWQKCLGGSTWDGAYSIKQTIEGGYVVCGYTESNNGDVSGNHGGQDFWALKLNSDGSILWQKCLGGSSDDLSRQIDITTNGGYVIAGRTDSNDGDVSGNHGNSDVWVVKLGNSPGCPILNASGTITNPLCAGSNNGSINIAPPTNGTPPYSYNWSNGSTTEDVNGLNAGIYSLTITDGTSCATTFSFTMTDPLPIQLALTSQSNICYGDAIGSISVSVSGGSPGYTYLWSNGATSSIITGLSSGAYTVTVTDTHNCAVTSVAQVAEPLPLELEMIGQNVSCYGMSNGTATVDVFGGIPGYLFEWSNGISNSFISNLTAGIYVVTVTDDNGCEGIDSIQIIQPSALSLNVAVVGATCFGDANGSASMSVAGGSPDYAYLWSNGANTSTINNLAAGIYSATVTDSHGCMQIGIGEILNPSPIMLSISEQDISCFGGSNGSASAIATGGSGSLSYVWSNGEISTVIDSLYAGMYSVTVSDSNACTVSLNIEIVSIDSVAPLMMLLEDTLYVTTFGTIEDFTSLADNFLDDCEYMYEILNSGDLNCVQQADTLEIYITDFSGNDTTYYLFITIRDTFPPQFVNCPGNIEQGTCQGAVIFNDPVASDNCQLVQMIQTAGLPSGSEYPVGTTINEWLATDINGNTQQCSNVVIISEGILLETNVQPISCHNQNDGSITIDTSHLTPPYMIVWNTGDTTAILHDLGEGNYSVIVTDDNDCQAMDTFDLNNPEFLFAFLQEKHDASSADSTDGFFIIDVSGGTPPYTYEWYQGDSLVSNLQNPANLGPGIYILFLRDAHQCLFVGLLVEIGIATGIEEIISSNLNVWPNPAKDFLFIESSINIQSLMLYDISGQLLETYHDINSTTAKLNMLDKHPGLYALMMVSGDGEGKIRSALISKAK